MQELQRKVIAIDVDELEDILVDHIQACLGYVVAPDASFNPLWDEKTDKITGYEISWDEENE